MIITKKKPPEALLAMLKGFRRVALVGCGNCATACQTGGEKELEQMRQLLEEHGFEVVGTALPEECCHMLLVKRDLKPLRECGAEVIVGMACGDGVQTVADNVKLPVVPANDTLFLGQIERAGVFPYSPEEGTPAARMLNRVDTAEAERRGELVVDVQSRIMDDYNDSRMGTVAEVLCDGFDQEAMQFVGRSYAESPDIDGRIYFTADHEVEAGEFVPVRITGTMDGELTGELAE